MQQNTVWGLLLIVFILWNGYGIANNSQAVIGGYASDFTYGMLVFEVIIVTALLYVLLKYYVPEWTRPKYSG